MLILVVLDRNSMAQKIAYKDSNCYFLSLLTRKTKRRRSTWARHATNMEDIRNAYKILIGKPKGRTSLEEISSGGRITLKLIFNSVWLC